MHVNSHCRMTMSSSYALWFTKSYNGDDACQRQIEQYGSRTLNWIECNCRLFDRRDNTTHSLYVLTQQCSESLVLKPNIFNNKQKSSLIFGWIIINIRKAYHVIKGTLSYFYISTKLWELVSFAIDWSRQAAIWGPRY